MSGPARSQRHGLQPPGSSILIDSTTFGCATAAKPGIETFSDPHLRVLQCGEGVRSIGDHCRLLSASSHRTSGYPDRYRTTQGHPYILEFSHN